MVGLFRNVTLTVIGVAAITLMAVAQHKYPTDFGQTSAQPQMPAPPTTQQSGNSASVPTSPGAQAPPVTPAPIGERKLSYDIQVSGAQQWFDTGIDLLPGDRVTLTGEGTLDYITSKATPEGLPRSWREVITALPVNSAGVGALIGRVGTAGADMPFLVGTDKQVKAVRAGRLFLGINQLADQAAQGSYKVKVQITPTTLKQASTGPAALKLSSDFFSRIPRRVEDQNGTPGDMINFVIIGPQEVLQQAFTDAGWVLVDRTKAEAALHAFLSTYSKKVYTEMPMSELYLFGRPQDFGYAHAEPVRVVQTRHHLRIWKADFEMDGQPVWVGAATHDIGFEHDNRSQSATAVTHKIDPDVDKEREFVGETLNATGDITALSRIVPPDPLREANTATGGTFHSDGQILVMRVGAQ